MNQAQLDAWLPTLVRYMGLLLAPVLVIAPLFGYGLDVIGPGSVLVTGLLLYKTVKGAASE